MIPMAGINASDFMAPLVSWSALHRRREGVAIPPARDPFLRELQERLGPETDGEEIAVSPLTIQVMPIRSRFPSSAGSPRANASQNSGVA